MIVTTYDSDKEDSEQITSKAGIGYMATDALTIGMARDGDDNYDFFARYTVKDQIWLAFNMPTKDGSDK